MMSLRTLWAINSSSGAGFNKSSRGSARQASQSFSARMTGLPWIEIDFPSDLLRAERTILPRLSRAVTEDEEADTDAA